MSETPTSQRHWPAVAAAFAAGAALIAFLFTDGRVLHLEWMAPLVWLAGPALLVMRFRRDGGQAESRPVPWAAIALLLCGVLYLFSSTADHKWFYFLNWLPAGRAGLFTLDSGIGRFVLVTLLCWPLVLLPSRRIGWMLAVLLVAAQALAVFVFLSVLDGRMLYNDDHPSFMSRLWILGKTFPRQLSYSPMWNGGYLEYAPLTTGANAPGIPLLPFWKWLSVPEFYPWGVALVYIAMIPALAAISIRIMGYSWRAAGVAAILSLGVSRYFFLWLLNYGTIGANFTAAFVMPIAACLYRVLLREVMDARTAVVLVLSVVFLLFWPIGLFMTLPMLFAVVCNARSCSWRKLLFLAACGAGALLLFLYPLLVILRASDVAQNQWVEPGSAGGIPWQKLAEGWDNLRWFAREVHPLILFLGIGGALSFADRRISRWFLPVIVGFAALAAWGTMLVPDLPLSRIAIPLFFVPVLPAAVLAARILETAGARLSLARAVIFGLLVMTGWNTVKIYANQGPGGYAAADPVILEMADWIKANTAPEDRILLPGGTSHFYGGGHVAFLPVLFEREMLSSEYRHDKTVDIRAGSPPELPPAKADGLDQYLDLFAPRYALTLDGDWIRFFNSNPDRFRAVRTFEQGDRPIRLYEILKPSTVFLKGSGAVRAELNRLHVKLDDPGRDAVIKYNWMDGLSSDEAAVFPVETAGGVRFIGVRAQGNPNVTITFRRWL